MFRPARINLIYFPVLSMCVEGANSQKLRTAEEMRSFFQECNKIFFDHIPCHWFNIYTDADEQMIKDFRTEAKLSPSTPDKQIFENLELFTEKWNGKERSSDVLRKTT